MGGKYGLRKFYFLKWEGNDVQFKYSFYTTPVVFLSDQANAKAVLKGHLLSNTDPGTNGQRHLVRDNEGYYHLLYVSM